MGAVALLVFTEHTPATSSHQHVPFNTKGLGVDAKVKWPNDVWVAKRKMSGIWVNCDGKHGGVVGFGVNVNQDMAKAEPAVATSLDAIKIWLFQEDSTRVGEILPESEGYMPMLLLLFTSFLVGGGNEFRVYPGGTVPADDLVQGFPSLDAALAARALGKSATTIVMKAGTHFLLKPIHLNENNTAGGPLNVIGEPGAVISGAVSIKGWDKSKTVVGLNGTPVWSATIPPPPNNQTQWDEGSMLQLWRGGGGTRLKVAATSVMNYQNATATTITFAPNQILSTYKDLDRAYIVLYESWIAANHKIAKIEGTTMTLATAWNPQWAGSASGARAYIENIVEALDEEGEFYFDVKANKVHLVSSKDPTTDSIVMAGFTQLLTATKASPVSFTALAFEYAAVETQSCFTGGCNGQSADFLTQAAVEVHESHGITFNQCSFSHVGGYAVWFGPNSTESSLTNSHIFDVGAGGVRIGNGSLNQKTSGHVVENNLIEDGGHVYQEGCGVLAQIGIDCAIKYAHHPPPII